MKSTAKPLPDDTPSLQKMVHDYQLTVDEMTAKLKWYEEQFRLFQHRQFGASSEKSPNQADLFNEAESILDAVEQSGDDGKETITYQRKKPGRKPLSKYIPREIVRH